MSLVFHPISPFLSFDRNISVLIFKVIIDRYVLSVIFLLVFLFFSSSLLLFFCLFPCGLTVFFSILFSLVFVCLLQVFDLWLLFILTYDYICWFKLIVNSVQAHSKRSTFFFFFYYFHLCFVFFTSSCLFLVYYSYQFSSVTQLCPTLCDCMD